MESSWTGGGRQREAHNTVGCSDVEWLFPHYTVCAGVHMYIHMYIHSLNSTGIMWSGVFGVDAHACMHIHAPIHTCTGGVREEMEEDRREETGEEK